MRALVIDPVAGQVREHDTDGSLAALQALVGGYIEAVYPERFDRDWVGHHMYLNEEGRLRPEIAVYRWQLAGWPEGHLCGPGVVLCSNARGGEAPATMQLRALRGKVSFMPVGRVQGMQIA